MCLRNSGLSRRAFIGTAGLLTLHSSRLLASTAQLARPFQLGLLPNYFELRLGERLHYNVVQVTEDDRLLLQSQVHFPDPKFSSTDPTIVRIIDPSGVIEAAQPGRTELVVTIPGGEQRFIITVAGPAQQPITAAPWTSVKELKAKEFLFVGHANRDGYDHTAVAKPGIDRLVKRAKENGVRVVYWVSAQYPDWYTEDRQPDYAIITEGQEHETRVDADKVTFTGGDFMFCTLRNVQMTLHTLLKNDPPERINFAFAADAIWYEDVWGPGAKRWYPAPMVLLSTIFARRANDEQRYDEVVLPFLNRTINEFPVLGYPRNAPTPPLRDLLKDRTIVVRFGNTFERVYQHGDANKSIRLDFFSV